MKLKTRLFQSVGIALCSLVLILSPVPANASTMQLADSVMIAPSHQVTYGNPVNVITVKPGDTLSELASKNGLTWQGLYCANRKVIGPDPDVIQVGMRLLLKSAKCSTGSGSNTQTITATGYTKAGTPQQIAWSLLANFGRERASQYACLNNIIMRESGWRIDAYNPSGAYGIPQALPGYKMGPGWQYSAYVQLHWMIKEYIPAVYGTPCDAWGFWANHGWY